ncbi:MAG: hypothetical protein ACRD4B_03600 [Acidobacteriota bacterium]
MNQGTKNKEGSILLMMMVIFGMFAVMLAASVAFINRQFHQTVDQEREELAFHMAEAGVQYTLFLLNDGVHNTETLLQQGELLEQSLYGIQYVENPGIYNLYFASLSGADAGQGLRVVSVGLDTGQQQCQTIVAEIRRFSSQEAAYALSAWDHRPVCATSANIDMPQL